jgi:recombination protein RecA
MAKKKSNILKIPTANALAKKYPKSGQASDIVVPEAEYLILPSRFLNLNYTIGGGIPYGKILELYGEESSGKSLLAIDFAYCCQQLGGVVLWADAEQAFTTQWAKANGLDLEKVIVYSETAVENISDWIADQSIYWRSVLVNNEPILCVVDSTAALDTQNNINSEMADGKADMGNRAKAIYKLLRIRNELLSDLGVTSIWINQLRQKIGVMFGDPDTTPGGAALKFYASIRIGVYGGKQILGKVNGYEDRVGRHSSIRVKKNKVAPPRPTIKGAEVYFNSEYDDKPLGFSKYFGLPDLLVRLGVVTKKKGASRYYMKDKMLANGSAAFEKLIREDTRIRKKLIRRSGINTISKTRTQAEAIGRNIFIIGSAAFESQAEE